jgi:hypothetical protein
MHRQGDERDCEAAASCHCGDSTPRVGGRIAESCNGLCAKLALTLRRPKR